jgi:RNA polymerase sigma-70 factor (ECF subfamily)
MASAAELDAVWSAACATPAPVARLVELCGDAARAHAGLVEDRELVAAIAARAPAVDLDAYLGRVRAGDLALAVAAARGSARAIAELERAFAAVIDGACRRFAKPNQSADDLRQILRAKLFVGPRPKIADYSGQGFLENWLRVTAVRVFIDLDKRKDRAREQPAADDDVLALPEPGDLALDLVKAEYRAAVATAMHEAAAGLEPGDRHLLRQHLVGGLSIDQLGAVLGIHRATAARRIARAKEQLAADTRRRIVARLALDARELDEVIDLVMSRLDISIARLLASAGPR